MMPRFVFAAWCVFGLLMGAAHAAGINGEATYISISVPGALGTYPTGINAAMEVTGYYNVSSTRVRGFLREADGTMDTFDVAGAGWTAPQAINAAGDITGSYRPSTGGPAGGFLRYANGRIVILAGNQVEYQTVTSVGINDFDDLVLNYFYAGVTVFTRSRTGELTKLPVPGLATAINANGSVVGVLFSDTGFIGFVAHPDGYWATIGPPQAAVCWVQTIPEAINAAGVIAGTFTTNYLYNPSCAAENTGGFVLSPNGEFTLFQPPGQMPYYHDLLVTAGSYPLQLVSLDAAGDIAGTYSDAAGDWHGFVRNPYGTITPFDPPESKFTTVTSINDGGAVAGYYQYNRNGTGPAIGFIRVPQAP